MITTYSQLSPCRHLAITDTPLLRTGIEVLAKRITENNSRYYRLPVLRTPNGGPKGVHNRGSWLYYLIILYIILPANLKIKFWTYNTLCKNWLRSIYILNPKSKKINM